MKRTTSTGPHRESVYRSVHDGIRAKLGALMVAAGRVDFRDRVGLRDLRSDVEDAFAVLRAHAEVEDTHLAPLLERVAPDLAAELEEAHGEQDAMMHLLLIDLVALEDAPTRRGANAFAASLSRFIGEVIVHLADEEELAMPALRSGTGARRGRTSE